MPGALLVAVGAALVAIGGGVLGLAELTGLGIAAILLVVVAVADITLRRPKLQLHRFAPRGRVFAGGVVEMRVRMRRDTRSPTLTIRDPIRDPDGHASTAVAVIPAAPPGEVQVVRYEFVAHRRGVWTVGPMSVRLTDPFGVATRTSPGADVVEVTVFPYVVRIDAPRMHRDSDIHGAPVSSPDGAEFASLREYQPGDDLRGVHWRSSARSEDLVVRRNEQPRRPGCTVVVDVRGSHHDAGSFERAVSIAASVIVAAAGADQRVRLVTTDGFDSGTGSGRDHVTLALTVLATLRVGPDTLVPFAHGGDPVVTVAGVTGDADLDAIAASRTWRVVLGVDSGATGSAADSILVGPDDPFDVVWNTHVRQHSRPGTRTLRYAR